MSCLMGIEQKLVLSEGEIFQLQSMSHAITYIGKGLQSNVITYIDKGLQNSGMMCLALSNQMIQEL